MPKRCLGDCIASLEDSSEVSKIKTQEKTQKLKEKTQNSRKNSKLKGKTQFSGISEANKVSQSALKKACFKRSGISVKRMQFVAYIRHIPWGFLFPSVYVFWIDQAFGFYIRANPFPVYILTTLILWANISSLIME